MVLWAVSFGFVVDGMLERSRWFRRGQWFALVTGVGLVHLPVFWAVVDSRTADVAEYRPLRQVHEVLGALEPGQRITSLDGPWGGRLRFVHGLSPRFAPPERKSLLLTEFREIFVFAPPSSVVERKPIYHSSALGSFAVIGHPSTSEPR